MLLTLTAASATLATATVRIHLLRVGENGREGNKTLLDRRLTLQKAFKPASLTCQPTQRRAARPRPYPAFLGLMRFETRRKRRRRLLPIHRQVLCSAPRAEPFRFQISWNHEPESVSIPVRHIHFFFLLILL